MINAVDLLEQAPKVFPVVNIAANEFDAGSERLGMTGRAVVKPNNGMSPFAERIG